MATIDELRAAIDAAMKDGLSRARIARRADVNNAALADLHRGRASNPTINTVERLADVMGYDVALIKRPQPSPTVESRQAPCAGTQEFAKKGTP